MAKSDDPRVRAIREDKLVGEGSCSSIDECMTDSELLEELEEDGIGEPTAAVKWARDREGLCLEQATNFRWGEDTDPELAVLREFKAARKGEER